MTVLVALGVGIAAGVLVARARGTSGLIDVRLWLIGAGVLAALARGPVTGALAGAAAVLGVMGALEVIPFRGDLADVDYRGVPVALVRDPAWIDAGVLLLGAVVGAAVGTVRLVLRTGRRLLLIAAAVVVLLAAVGLGPELPAAPVLGGQDAIR